MSIVKCRVDIRGLLLQCLRNYWCQSRVVAIMRSNILQLIDPQIWRLSSVVNKLLSTTVASADSNKT